jgi:O-antigen/teichoic acid export membrane protein
MAPLISIALHFLNIQCAFPIALLSANVLGCIFYLPLMRKLFPGNPGAMQKKVPKDLLLYSLPRGVSEVVGSILYRVDLWMVLLLLGPGEAGVYSIMLIISNALRTVANSFGPILLPVVAGMNEERLKSDLKPTFSYCVGMTATIQLIIGFFIVLFPEEILSIAGKEFILQPETLGILLFANISASFFGMVMIVLNGLGKSFYVLKTDIISLCAAFAANYFLIPVFGLAGAAISTLIFTFTQAILNNIYLFKLGYFPYAKKLLIYMGWIIALAVFFAMRHGYG